jgi:hypothetical protein
MKSSDRIITGGPALRVDVHTVLHRWREIV